MVEPILEVKNLKTYIETPQGVLRAVDDLSFSLLPGESKGIVGESGSGKTVACLSIMQLIEPPVRVVDGEIQFNGQDLLKCSASELEDLRGKDISMIFQDPLTSLNPIFTIEQQMTDVIKRHLKVKNREAHDRALEVLTQVGVSAPEQRLRQYPFQLSGGLRQRVMIAMALLLNPKLVIADEPTTALDVSIQAQILNLLKDLQSRLHFAMIFVSHDLGIIANLTDTVSIMYASRNLESAPTQVIFTAPAHPYTVGLLQSAPTLSSSRQNRLKPINGTLPDMVNLPPGCPFAPRCEYCTNECEQSMPRMQEYGDGHRFACYHPLGTH